MGRRRRQLPRYDGIIIHGLSSEGFGVARHNDKVVFVEDAVPGDQGDVQVTK
ncbi:MAG TPA: 23S rRNA (uracil-5-)-methyltransferase RumA, partial [Bacteroidetes bacterium]|nr:23S rRNA (uracil-5-)-methyltransferase RumA [Bacteroidota bacterium]